MSGEQILEILGQHSKTIRGFGVRGLALFGSAARGNAGPASDLDFVVDF